MDKIYQGNQPGEPGELRKMLNRNSENMARKPNRGSLFLPKYQRIIEGLYRKASDQDERAGTEIQTITTIEDLNNLNLSKSVMKKK